MSGDDTITRDELVAYYKRNTACNDEPGAVDRALEACEYVAGQIFDDVKAHREPEYEPGAVYQDPEGRAWFRLRRSAINPGREPGWRCCESGTSYAHHVPARPLHRMVRGVRPSVAEIDRLIADAYGQGHGELAERICALLDGVPS